jgi:hypothetical protein
MTFVIAGAAGISVLSACAAARREPKAEPPARDSLLPLAIEYGGPIQTELTAGQSLTLRPSLRNAGSQPVTISHGTRFFVLDAQFFSSRTPYIPLGNYQFPRADTWGEAKHLEYPNPFAVYTLPLISKTLQPGEAYAPALLYQRSEYLVHFDSTGRYAIRVCAHLTSTILCGRRDIAVTVK